MIQINTLYSLEDVQAFYFITEDLRILNSKTGAYLSIWTSKRGYPSVSLQRTCGGRVKTVPMHKIAALAFVNNGPYQLIEHLNDDKLDYRPCNLKFSTPEANGRNAFATGAHARKGTAYEATLTTGERFYGFLTDIAKMSGISQNSLYWHAKQGNSTFTPKGTDIKVTLKRIGQQTIEMGPGA